MQPGYPPPGYAPPIWTCPFCRWQGAPVNQSKVSGAGWIVFTLLLIFTCGIFCWVGLLMKERWTACGHCRTRVN